MRLLKLALLMQTAVVFAADDGLLGFDTAGSSAQLSLEEQFDRSLSAADQDEWLRRMSARPHRAGSQAGRENAEFIAGLFASWGFDVDTEQYDILLPTPRTREVELVGPNTFSASLKEDPLSEDSSTSVADELLPPYNAFSIDGEVEGELVFVNYGMPEDYDMLERHGVSERVLTREQGLPGRPWYKHHVYAPGFYTGYDVKTIPGVREAIEQREYGPVGPQIALAAEVLNDMAARIETIAASGSN